MDITINLLSRADITSIRQIQNATTLKFYTIGVLSWQIEIEGNKSTEQTWQHKTAVGIVVIILLSNKINTKQIFIDNAIKQNKANSN